MSTKGTDHDMDTTTGTSESLSRRGLLRRGGMLAVGGGLLAACGGTTDGSIARIGRAPEPTSLGSVTVDDVVLLRTTAALSDHVRAMPQGRSVAAQIAAGVPVAYGRALSWRGVLDVEPPRRPEPQRVSSPAAWRAAPWKYAFVGSRDPETGRVHLPPSRVSADGLRTDTMDPAPLAAATGTVATFTVDRVAYSPSPPIIFAVVDFDGGGRFPVELCDLAPDEVAIGTRVALTFRRLHAADGIPNYFWKARPLREAPMDDGPGSGPGSEED